MVEPRELPYPLTARAVRSLLCAACLRGVGGIYVFAPNKRPRFYSVDRMAPPHDRRKLREVVSRLSIGPHTYLFFDELNLQERIELRRAHPSTLASYSPFT